MDPVVTCAEHTLEQSPHPALKLSELLEAVAEALDRTLDAKRLRGVLESHPDRFKVLEPWRGHWGLHAAGAGDAADAVEPLVVTIADPVSPTDDTDPQTHSLRESVRWMARGVDLRSPAEVSRWYAMVMSERKIRPMLSRRAA